MPFLADKAQEHGIPGKISLSSVTSPPFSTSCTKGGAASFQGSTHEKHKGLLSIYTAKRKDTFHHLSLIGLSKSLHRLSLLMSKLWAILMAIYRDPQVAAPGSEIPESLFPKTVVMLWVHTDPSCWFLEKEAEAGQRPIARSRAMIRLGF